MTNGKGCSLVGFCRFGFKVSSMDQGTRGVLEERIPAVAIAESFLRTYELKSRRVRISHEIPSIEVNYYLVAQRASTRKEAVMIVLKIIYHRIGLIMSTGKSVTIDFPFIGKLVADRRIVEFVWAPTWTEQPLQFRYSKDHETGNKRSKFLSHEEPSVNQMTMTKSTRIMSENDFRRAIADVYENATGTRSSSSSSSSSTRRPHTPVSSHQRMESQRIGRSKVERFSQTSRASSEEDKMSSLPIVLDQDTMKSVRHFSEIGERSFRFNRRDNKTNRQSERKEYSTTHDEDLDSVHIRSALSITTVTPRSSRTRPSTRDQGQDVTHSNHTNGVAETRSRVPVPPRPRSMGSMRNTLHRPQADTLELDNGPIASKQDISNRNTKYSQRTAKATVQEDAILRNEQLLWKIREENEMRQLEQELIQENLRLQEIRKQEQLRRALRQSKEDLHMQMLEQRMLRDQEERDFKETSSKWVEEIKQEDALRLSEIQAANAKRNALKTMLDLQVEERRLARDKARTLEEQEEQALMDKNRRAWLMRHEYETRRKMEMTDELRRTWEMQLRQRALEQELTSSSAPRRRSASSIVISLGTSPSVLSARSEVVPSRY